MASKEAKNVCETCCPASGGVRAGASGGIYGLAFVGAAIYFIEHATTFWMGVLGVAKALIWPAILIYKIMERLNI